MSSILQNRLAVLAPFLKTKKVYVFGTGKGGARVFSVLREHGVDVSCFLDNRAETICEFKGVQVMPPSALDKEVPTGLAVVVASQTYREAMENQLVQQGLKRGVDFFSPMEPLQKIVEDAAPMTLSKKTQKYEGEFSRVFLSRDPRRGVSLTLDETYTLYQGVLATRELDGCLAEVGVFRGGSARIICEAKGQAPLYLCDTFEGMPSIQGSHDPEGVWVNTHTTTSLESVREYVGDHPNVLFVKGIFPSSVAQHGMLDMDKKSFKFVHLDVDLYESTLKALEWFWPRMVSGGWLVSHNYNLTYGKWGNTPGVKKAFQTYLGAEACRIVEVAETQALIIKP